jgi:transcription initiation factor TFIID subunit 5
MIFSVTAAEIAEDSSLLAVGFSDSTIKIWSLIPQKLRLMKTAEQLQDIDREAGNIYAFEKIPEIYV